MEKIENIGSSSEIIKNIKKNVYQKNEFFVVDDLSVLDLECAKSCEIEIFIFAEELIYSDLARGVRDYYVTRAKKVYQVSSKVFESICEKENCAGLLAVLKKKKLDFAELKEKNPSFVLINDGIEIAGNMGTIFRTADAVGLDLVVNTSIKTSVYNSKVLHSSRGMVLSVPFVNSDIDETAKFLLDNGYKIMLCEPENGVNYFEADYMGKIAIVIGCERYGINKHWFDFPHENIYIDMFGTMSSLNVGVAGSVILYQAKMKRKN